MNILLLIIPILVLPIISLIFVSIGYHKHVKEHGHVPLYLVIGNTNINIFILIIVLFSIGSILTLSLFVIMKQLGI